MSDTVTQATKKHVKTFGKIAFAGGLIYWMIKKGALDIDAFAKLASPLMIIGSLAYVFFMIFACNFRWLLLMRGQGFKSDTRHTLPLSLIGVFFNFAMPGGVGGDVVKGYYLLQDYPRQKIAGALSIFMDRMMGFFVMIGTAFLALFFNWYNVSHSRELQSIAVGVSLLFLGFLAFFFLSLSKTLKHPKLDRFLFEKLPGGNKLRSIYDVLHSYRQAPGALIGATLLSMVNQVLMIFFAYTIGQTMGEDVPLKVYFFLVPIGMVVQALPISPAGIGVGQAAFYFLFNLYLQRASQLGPTVMTSFQLMNVFWAMFGAFFYLQRKKPAVVMNEPELEPAVKKA